MIFLILYIDLKLPIVQIRHNQKHLQDKHLQFLLFYLNLVEPVSNIPHNDVLPTFSTVDDPSELQGVESPPEFHVVDMNDKNILDDSTIDNEVDPEVNGVSATTAVTYITRNNIKDMDNRYGPHSCRYHLRIE